MLDADSIVSKDAKESSVKQTTPLSRETYNTLITTKQKKNKEESAYLYFTNAVFAILNT